MENILNSINSRCVSLNAEEKKRNNVIVHKVLDTVLKNLQTTDVLFKSLYERNYYGGSYYDGLKVGSSNEFDIDMLFVLPKIVEPTVISSDKPGYVHVALSQLEKLDEKYKGLDKLCDANTKRISAKKTLSWIEGLLTKCFNSICPNGKVLTSVAWGGKQYDVMVKLKKSGPANTMIIVAEAEDESVIKMDVDLVPCLLFTKASWPSKSSNYRQYNPTNHGNVDTFFVVPKLPTEMDKPDFYWRLSFQQQERELISGNELGRLKPALRLLKKVRDRWDHPISSYFIKTVFLWEVETRSKTFWNKPLNEVFCGMLQVYGEKLKSGSINYFWNAKFNLLSSYKKSTLDGIANKINNILSDINRLSEVDPFGPAKHIVSIEEVEILRKEVDIGKKKTKLLAQLSIPPPVSSVSPAGGSQIDEILASTSEVMNKIQENPEARRSFIDGLKELLEKVKTLGLNTH